MGMLGMTIMPAASANNTDGESQDKTTKTSVELRWFNPTVRGSVGGDGYLSERTYENKLDFEHDLGVSDMHNAPEIKITHGKWSVDYIRMGNDVKGYRLKAPIKHKFDRRNLLYAGVCGRGCYRLLCRYLLRNSVGVHPLCFLKQRLKCETVLKPQS